MYKYHVLAVRMGDSLYRRIRLISKTLSKVTQKLNGLKMSRSEVARDMIEFAYKNGYVKNKIKDLKGKEKQ